MAGPRKRSRPVRASGICDELQRVTEQENPQTDDEKVNKKKQKQKLPSKEKGTAKVDGKGKEVENSEYRELLKDRLRPARSKRVNYGFDDQWFEEDEGAFQKKRRNGNKQKRKVSKAKADEEKDGNVKENVICKEKGNGNGGKKRKIGESEETEENQTEEEKRGYSTRALVKPKRMGEFVSDNSTKKKTHSQVRNPFFF